MRQSPERQAVLRELHASRSGLTIRDLAARLGKPYDRMKLYLWRMAHDGLIAMVDNRYRVAGETHETYHETPHETAETFPADGALQDSSEVSEGSQTADRQDVQQVSSDTKPQEASDETHETHETRLVQQRLEALTEEHSRLRQDHERLWQLFEELKEDYREQRRIDQIEKQRLMNLLDDEKKEKRLLLEAPRPAAGAIGFVSPALLREQLRTWMQAHPGPHHRVELEQALGVPNLKDRLRRMVDTGLLVRVAPGVFQLTNEA